MSYRPQSPLAAAAQNLMGAFARLPGPADRALAQAKMDGLYASADASRSTAALNQQKVRDAQAAASAPSELAKIAQGILTPAEQPRPDPEFTGPLPQRTREQAVEQAWPAIMQQAAAINPNNIGTVARGFLATVPGLQDTSVIDRAMLSAGDNYASTIGGTREKQAADAKQEQWKVLNTPHSVSAGGDLASAAQGVIARGRDTESTVKGRILNGMSPEEQKAAMLKKGIRIQSADGNVIEVGGTGELAKPTVGALEKTQFGLQDFNDTLSMLDEIAAKDPTIFGTTGNARRLWQGITEQGKNVAMLTGDPAKVDEHVAKLGNALKSFGINPTLVNGELDPNLFNVETVARLAAYQAASALASQEGRSVSDKDVKQFQAIIGDPAAWTSSQAQFRAGLSRLKDIVTQRMSRGQQRLGPQGSAASVPPNVNPAAAKPRIKIDADGNVVQ